MAGSVRFSVDIEITDVEKVSEAHEALKIHLGQSSRIIDFEIVDHEALGGDVEDDWDKAIE